MFKRIILVTLIAVMLVGAIDTQAATLEVKKVEVVTYYKSEKSDLTLKNLEKVVGLKLNASGNGLNDDTYAIQEAINVAAANHSKVVIPAGTYKVTSSLNVTGTDFSIQLMKDAKIVSSNLRSSAIFNINNAKNVTIYGEGTVQGDYTGLEADKTNAIIMIKKSTDVLVNGLTVKNAKHLAIGMEESTDVVISNNVIMNTYNGIHDTSGLRNAVVNNIITRDQAAQDASYDGRDRGIRGNKTNELLIEGNVIEQYSLSIEMYHSTDLVVINKNTIRDTGFGISLDRGHNSTVSNNLITANKIDVNFKIGIELAESNNVLIDSNKITVISDSMTGNGIAVWNAETGSGKSSDGAKVMNNEITGVSTGIALSGVTNTLVNNNCISKTNIGIEMAMSNGKNITISNNKLKDQLSYGIFLPGNRGYQNVTIKSNNIVNSGDTSISLSQSGNGVAGEILTANLKIDVLNNSISNSNSRSINATLVTGKINGNTIEKSAKSGIYFYGANVTGSVEISNNKIVGSFTKKSASEAGLYLIEVKKNMVVTMKNNAVSGTVNGQDIFVYNVSGVLNR